MSANHHYDVIIIGTGAGGGTLAYRLAPSGKKILLLERGDYVPREKQNWDSRAVIGEGRYNNVEPWRDAKAMNSLPAVIILWAATRNSTERLWCVCVNRTSASCATTTAFHR